MSTAYRESNKVKDWINLILAVLLFISPWVLDFKGEIVPAWNAWIMGVVLAILALAEISPLSGSGSGRFKNLQIRAENRLLGLQKAVRNHYI